MSPYGTKKMSGGTITVPPPSPTSSMIEYESDSDMSVDSDWDILPSNSQSSNSVTKDAKGKQNEVIDEDGELKGEIKAEEPEKEHGREKTGAELEDQRAQGRLEQMEKWRARRRDAIIKACKDAERAASKGEDNMSDLVENEEDLPEKGLVASQSLKLKQPIPRASGSGDESFVSRHFSPSFSDVEAQTKVHNNIASRTTQFGLSASKHAPKPNPDDLHPRGQVLFPNAQDSKNRSTASGARALQLQDITARDIVPRLAKLHDLTDKSYEDFAAEDLRRRKDTTLGRDSQGQSFNQEHEDNVKYRQQWLRLQQAQDLAMRISEEQKREKAAAGMKSGLESFLRETQFPGRPQHESDAHITLEEALARNRFVPIRKNGESSSDSSGDSQQTKDLEPAVVKTADIIHHAEDSQYPVKRIDTPLAPSLDTETKRVPFLGNLKHFQEAICRLDDFKSREGPMNVEASKPFEDAVAKAKAACKKSIDDRKANTVDASKLASESQMAEQSTKPADPSIKEYQSARARLALVKNAKVKERAEATITLSEEALKKASTSTRSHELSEDSTPSIKNRARKDSKAPAADSSSDAKVKEAMKKVDPLTQNVKKFFSSMEAGKDSKAAVADGPDANTKVRHETIAREYAYLQSLPLPHGFPQPRADIAKQIRSPSDPVMAQTVFKEAVEASKGLEQANWTFREYFASLKRYLSGDGMVIWLPVLFVLLLLLVKIVIGQQAIIQDHSKQIKALKAAKPGFNLAKARAKAFWDMMQRH